MIMEDNELFDDLLKQHDPKQLAESHIFPAALTEKEKQETSTSLQKVLSQKRAIISSEDERTLTLMQLRFQIEEYLNGDHFDSEKTVGFFLAAYIRILGKKQKSLASEINISATELNHYVKNSRNLPMEIMVRLELHSLGIIPAEDWLGLISKQKFYQLKTNQSLREQQRKFVTAKTAMAEV